MSKDKLTVNTLTVLSGRNTEEPITIDEMHGWLLNVSFALLFIFIIASFISKARLESDLRLAIDERDGANLRWEEAKKTPEGKLVEKNEKTLIELQLQQLLKALDEVDAEDRKSFGLSVFSSSIEGGRLVFNVDGILSGEKVSDNALVKNNFVDGSARAKQVLRLPYSDKWHKWQKNWTSRVLLRAEKRFRQEGEKLTLISSNFEVVEENNQLKLEKEIGRRTSILYSDFCTLQATVVGTLFGYYMQNPKLLDGTEIAEVVDKYLSADAATRDMLVLELESKLWLHAKNIMGKQGVMLLSGAQEK